MSMTTTITTVPADQLPILPETHPIEPIVQCGVLYLGTAPSSTGLRSLDSIQEPFSHRYPVDGTNTTRGIDAILSVYDNGFQLAFTRQPYSVIFFPIASLIYCASLRFSIIESDQTKPLSNIDWRFLPLKASTVNENKHPPLFCAVTQRTQILPGDECHCFITKTSDAAVALVQTISQVYANIQPGIKCLKSPIFYQLDRYGRKLSETIGIVYISPANDDDSQVNRTHPVRLTDDSIAQKYLLDPAFDGFYYRTDASLVEQWQLWDDNDLNGSRPHPPASPFGLHEGLYHDDTTKEIQRHLRRMEDEEHSCSCSCSSSASSTSTEYSRRQARHRRSHKQKLSDNTDQFNESFSQLLTSSFEPVLTQNRFNLKNTRPKKPIIIEKVLPKSFPSIPILKPKLPQVPLDPSDSSPKTNTNYISSSDVSSFSYQINERGEKITNEGNRIVFMDVIRADTKNNQIQPSAPTPLKSRPHAHRQRRSKPIPVVDLQSIEKIFKEKKPKIQQHASTKTHNNLNDDLNHTDHLTTADMFEILDGYYEDHHGHKIKLDNDEAQSLLDLFRSSGKKKQQRKNSVISSTDSSKSEIHHHHSRPPLTIPPSVHYGERPLIPSLSQSQTSSTRKQIPPAPPILTDDKLDEYVTNIYGTAIPVKSTSSPKRKQKSPTPSILTDDKLNEYVANIYGTVGSVKSTSPSNKHQDIKPFNETAVINANYISSLRYMHSSLNLNFLREYYNAY